MVSNMADLIEHWRAAIAEELPAAVELRHELHANPRVSGEEGPTAERIVRALGVGPGKTVAGTGRLVPMTGDGSRPAIALRTELDALPVQEETDVAWRARGPAMHACGHDVHMAALAVVARAATRIELPVPLVALLQPREEGPQSGAWDVVEEGGMAGVEAVVAAHCQPQLPAGTISAVAGPVNAGSCAFEVEVRGRSGHSGYPHTVDDSVLALSAVVVALQQVGARRIDPTVGVACMVNQLDAGTTYNVVPGRAVARGSLRTMRASDLDLARAAMRSIVEGVASGHGCVGEIRFASGEPALVNDAVLAAGAAERLAQMGHPVSTDFRSFGSDDFSYYVQHARSLMMFVGTGTGTGGLHAPTYLPDDRYVSVVADALVAGYAAAVT
jgi:amidohydrolase